MALLILAGCEQAGRAIDGAIPLKKAIAELPYSGDRPDAPPLEQRGNAVFSDAAFDDTGALLLTISFFGSARLQVWDAANGTLGGSARISATSCTTRCSRAMRSAPTENASRCRTGVAPPYGTPPRIRCCFRCAI